MTQDTDQQTGSIDAVRSAFALADQSKPNVTIGQPFVPDLGGWNPNDLMRLAYDITYRSQLPNGEPVGLEE